jgi:rare lipoprotein A
MSVARLILTSAALVLALNCGGNPRIALPPPIPARVGFVETGMASWYGHPYHGRKTSNGEIYDMEQFTAAHLQLPFNTVVRVTNLVSELSVDVRINDRGPFIDDRIVDLSRAAARQIGMIGEGTAMVRLEVLEAPGGLLEQLPPPADVLVSKSADCGSGPYYGAQVGSFADIENAERMQGKMRLAYGAAAILTARSADGRPLYRVVVGAADAGGELDALRKRLADDGIESFVQRISAEDAQGCT